MSPNARRMKWSTKLPCTWRGAIAFPMICESPRKQFFSGLVRKNILDGRALIKTAEHRLYTGWWLALNGHILETNPEVPMSERSRYRLMRDMEANHWQCCFASRRKKVDGPYRNEETQEKTWWVLVPTNLDDLEVTVVVLPYLMALLQSEQHGRDTALRPNPRHLLADI